MPGTGQGQWGLETHKTQTLLPGAPRSEETVLWTECWCPRRCVKISTGWFWEVGPLEGNRVMRVERS